MIHPWDFLIFLLNVFMFGLNVGERSWWWATAFAIMALVLFFAGIPVAAFK